MSNEQTVTKEQSLIKINASTKVNQIPIHKFLKQNEKQIMAALPKHVNADRIMRIALTEISKTPKLKECSAKSLFGAIIQCSQLGLEPGGALGQAYLIPYGDVCQFIIGYKGMIDLARRSGHILSINSKCVYKGELFEFEYGIEEKLKHIPSPDVERTDNNIIAAYAIAKLKDGGYQMELMFKNEIEKIRARAKAAKNGPWITDYAEMAKKTVVRRLFKYLPISIELAETIEKDYKADLGEQDNNIVIDADYETINEHAENKQPEQKADRVANKLSEAKEKQEDAKPQEGIPADESDKEWLKNYDNN